LGFAGSHDHIECPPVLVGAVSWWDGGKRTESFLVALPEVVLLLACSDGAGNGWDYSVIRTELLQFKATLPQIRIERI
jgi:hypothetical protein